MPKGQGHITIRRRPKDGAAGRDAVRLDLTNQNASILYDGEGTNISGTITSEAKLYEGASEVGQGVEYSIFHREGCTVAQAAIDPTTGDIFITDINTSGYIIVNAKYNGITYAAKLVLTKIVGNVKYDLIVTPNAIAYNSTTGEKSASKIVAQVFRTTAAVGGTSTREPVGSVADGCMVVDGSTITSWAVTGKEIVVDFAKTEHVVSIYAKSVLQDSETIPINAVENGEDGKTAYSPQIGDNGNWWFYDDSLGAYADSGRPATGDDGHSPYIGDNGNWYEYDTTIKQYEDTGVKAEGADAYSPYIGDNGNWFFYNDATGEYEDSGRSATGDDGHSPYIGENGNWYEWDAATGDYADTGMKAKGESGKSPYAGANGNWWFYNDETGEYEDSGRSTTGDDGHSPYVGANGNWYEYDSSTGEYEDTGVKAEGTDGKDGVSVSIDTSSHMFIYNSDKTLLNGSFITNVRVYNGTMEVPPASVIWSARSSDDGSVEYKPEYYLSNNGVLTVSNVKRGGYIAIHASYGGVDYTLKFIYTREVREATYSLLVSPKAITYRKGETSEQVTILVQKSIEVANGAKEITTLSTLPSGVSISVNGDVVTYSSSGYTFTPTAGTYYIRLVADGSLIGKEDVVVSQVEDGTPGPQGDTGETGPQGAAGAIRRASEWASGKSYLSGAAGEAYQDLVVYNGLHYLCKLSHTSATGRKPSASSAYWTEMSDLEFLATKGIFVGTDQAGWIADAGRLYHTSGLIELSADGTIKTSNGVFSVDKNGNLVAKAGQFKGKVEATEGSIGNFTLVDGWLESQQETYGVDVSASSIILSSRNHQLDDGGRVTASVMANSYPSLTTALMTLLHLSSALTPGSYSTTPNVVLRLSATGANSATYSSSGSPSGGNFAIWCDAGMFAGLRPHTRVVTSTSARLANTDNTVVVRNSSGCTITLPQTPEIGQEFEIWHVSTTNLNIQSYSVSSGRKYIMGSDGAYAYSFASTKREVIKFKYAHGLYKSSSAEGGIWLVMYYGTA